MDVVSATTVVKDSGATRRLSVETATWFRALASERAFGGVAEAMTPGRSSNGTLAETPTRRGQLRKRLDLSADLLLRLSKLVKLLQVEPELGTRSEEVA